MRLYDYAGSPNCYKVRLALAELELEFEHVPIDIFGGDTLTEEYGRINPARNTPVLELGDGDRLYESNAILLYLAEGTDLLPADRRARAEVHRWMFYEQSRIVTSVGGLRLRLARRPPESDDDHDQVRRDRRIALAALGLVELHLGDGRPFLLGEEFSIADVCVYGYSHAAGEAGIDTARMPALHAWLGRVCERPHHVADLEPLGEGVRAGATRSVYDFVGI